MTKREKLTNRLQKILIDMKLDHEQSPLDGVPSPPKINFAKQHSTLSNNFQLLFSTTNCNKYNIQLHLITFIFNV